MSTQQTSNPHATTQCMGELRVTGHVQHPHVCNEGTNSNHLLEFSVISADKKTPTETRHHHMPTPVSRDKYVTTEICYNKSKQKL